MALNRRNTLIGAAAFSASLTCEPVAAAILPLQSCGCPRVHELAYGHTCAVHDETGKRWDSYTANDVAKAMRIEFEPAQAEWSCYCGRHEDEGDCFIPVGTPCRWEKTSYEYDEWECCCAEATRSDFIRDMQTDWIAMSKELD